MTSPELWLTARWADLAAGDDHVVTRAADVSVAEVNVSLRETPSSAHERTLTRRRMGSGCVEERPGCFRPAQGATLLQPGHLWRRCGAVWQKKSDRGAAFSA